MSHSRLRSERPRRAILSRLLGWGLLTALSLALAPAAPAVFPPLVAGLEHEDELKSGESRVYPVHLEAGQFLRVVVEERGLDLDVRLLDPAGRTIGHADTPFEAEDPSGCRIPEELAAVAPGAGLHRVEVHALSGQCQEGRYRLRVEALGKPSAEDLVRVEAADLTQKAFDLRSERSEEAKRRQAALSEQALPLWIRLGERRREAVVVSGLGAVRLGLGELDRAADLQHRESVLWAELDEPSKEAQALILAGRVDSERGRRDEAIDHYRRAAGLARRSSDRTLEARAMNSLGRLYTETGPFDVALAHLEAALQLAREAENHKIEASVLTNLGSAYDSVSDFQESLKYYRLARALAQKERNQQEEAAALNNLGTVYEALGEWEEAAECHLAALKIVGARGWIDREAKTRNNLGLVYQRQGKLEEAKVLYEKALQLAEACQCTETQASALNNLSFLHLQMDEPATALHHLQRALPLASGQTEVEAASRQALGQAYAQMGDLAAGRRELGKAIQLGRDQGDLGRQATVTLAFARLEKDAENLEAAANHALEAMRLVESRRTRVARQDLRIAFLAAKQDLYELAVEVLMALGREAEALQVSERARARSLLDLLSEADANLFQGAPPALARRVLEASREVSARETRRLRLAEGNAPGARILEATRQRDEALERYRQAEADLRASSPRYKALTETEPLKLPEIQHDLLDSETLLLEYALGRERSFLWAVTESSLRSFELPPREQIEEAARDFYDLLTAGRGPEGEPVDARLERTEAGLAATGAELSRMVLGPVEGLLGERRLVVVSDGALQYVPFAALPLPSTRSRPEPLPLVARHEIVNLPSASVLALLRNQVEGRPYPPGTLAVLADPVFHSNDSRVRPPAAARSSAGPKGEVDLSDLSRLVFSKEEADKIASFVPPDKRLKALGFDATREIATSGALARYRFVHFATHGLLDSEHPELSGLVFSLVDRQGKPRNGFLRLHDIYNLRLNADLVVLSACQTALGAEVRGEGLIGLTRGFMHAGAARVVASLWSVDDRSTAELMKRFYRGMLVEKKNPATALRAAQLDLRADPRWRSPYFWAAFSLQGEWR